MCNFKKGQKIVCIKPIDDLIKGEIYTVEFISVNRSSAGVVLEEIKSIGYEGGFLSFRFRPLDESFSDKIETYIKEKVKEESLVNI